MASYREQPSGQVAPISPKWQAILYASVLVFWTMVCGLVASNGYLRRNPQLERTWTWYFIDQIGFYMPFLVVTIFIFLLAQYQQRHRAPLKHMILANLMASLAWMAVYGFYAIWWFLWHRGLAMDQFWDYFAIMHGINSLFDYAIYWFIATAVYAGVLYRESRIRERDAAELSLRTSQLEGMLTKSQLEALKAQLHPHFLFNTLNSISSFFRTGENEQGLALLVKFSDLLRSLLTQGSDQWITLRQELAFIDLYLDIEAVRFEDRLVIGRDIDPGSLDLMVPSMILQPLVENAIRHGVSQSLVRAELILETRIHEGRLDISVRNDGPQLSDPQTVVDPEEGGIGLRNTLMRLDTIYGGAARLDLTNWDRRGVVARLSLPVETSARGAPQ
ncbi:Histidine kinase [Sulfidibacter corallicola]|uniref:Histidine kinase n=1 Tax=Sulfidibacter corallicola TaxID=2818388 RepID=A0A8A4TT52_SULCO|nr:histidine kinase [Sulfidibacter corallicola]QTD49715.1 histidine kinase [Sulfidibacter corallicola]